MTTRAKAYIALITTTIIWGSAFAIIKPALDYISPTQFLYFRYLIAAPLMLPVLIYYLIKLKPKALTLLKITVLEISTYLMLIFLYQGLKMTSAIEASLVGIVGPLFTILGGIIFLKEKEERKEWLGLIISLIGTLIIVLEPIYSGQSHSQNFSIQGNLLIIGYNVTWAAYLLIAKKAYKSISKVFISSFSYPIGVITLFIVLSIQGASTSISLLQINAVKIAVVYMGTLGSIVGFTCYMYGQNKIEASEAALFNYLQSIVAIPAAMFLLKESVTAYQIIAIIVISVGVFIGEYKPKKLAKKSI